MRSIRISRNAETQRVDYRPVDDGWEVKGVWQDEFTMFADENASDKDVAQLIRKKYDDRY